MEKHAGLSIFVTVVAAFLVTSCGLGLVPDAVQIAGVVLDVDTGEPLSGVRVSQPFSSAHVMSDDNGEFLLERVFPSSGISFSKDGLYFPIIPVPTATSDGIATVVVAGGQELASFDFRVFLVLSENQTPGPFETLVAQLEVGSSTLNFPTHLIVDEVIDWGNQISTDGKYGNLFRSIVTVREKRHLAFSFSADGLTREAAVKLANLTGNETYTGHYTLFTVSSTPYFRPFEIYRDTSTSYFTWMTFFWAEFEGEFAGLNFRLY